MTATSAALPRQRINWRRWRLLAIGCLLVGLVLFCAVFAGIVAPYSPYDLDVSIMLQGHDQVAAVETARRVTNTVTYDWFSGDEEDVQTAQGGSAEAAAAQPVRQ